jgi:ABC-type transporter lipoprotein component MlaA
MGTLDKGEKKNRQRGYDFVLKYYQTPFNHQSYRLFMLSLDEIETAIRQLPTDEIRELAVRLYDYLDELWEQQLESDFQSGKLDLFIAKAEADIAANPAKELNEVLDNT